MKPLVIDLYCGLGGWADGFLAEDYRVVGFDIERHDYGTGGYPGQLVIQDVTTLHGSQFRDAVVIVASPPCQAYSYRAMPWKRAKALPPPDNTLFETCFRLQREASEVVGRHIPMVVENVRGAQKWVGRAKANFGSYYLWGDVGMVGRRVVAGIPRFGVSVAPIKATKVPGFRFDGSGGSFQTASVEETGHKTSGLNWSNRELRGQDFTRIAGNQRGAKTPAGNCSALLWKDREIARYSHPTKIEERKHEFATDPDKGGSWFGNYQPGKGSARNLSSNSPRRKAASAMIAKIPFPLAQYIARCFKPLDSQVGGT